MGKPRYIENFKDKLDLLLIRHPVIRQRNQLAAALGLSDGSQITKWQGGEGYLRAGLIPAVHCERICELFAVSAQWLEERRRRGESPQAFLDRLREALQPRTLVSPWRALIQEAADSPGLQLRRVPRQGGIFRGLIYPPSGDPASSPTFHPGDRVYVELSDDERDHPAYLAVFAIDPAKTQCLCPASEKFAPAHRVEAPMLRIPTNAPEGFLEVDNALGMHSLIAIVMLDPLPSSLCEALIAQLGLERCLDEVAVMLQGRPRNSWRCMRYRYEVTSRQNPDTQNRPAGATAARKKP